MEIYSVWLGRGTDAPSLVGPCSTVPRAMALLNADIRREIERNGENPRTYWVITAQELDDPDGEIRIHAGPFTGSYRTERDLDDDGNPIIVKVAMATRPIQPPAIPPQGRLWLLATQDRVDRMVRQVLETAVESRTVPGLRVFLRRMGTTRLTVQQGRWNSRHVEVVAQENRAGPFVRLPLHWADPRTTQLVRAAREIE